LDLTAHHPRFEQIRTAYVNALSDVPPADVPGATVSHHWLRHFILEQMMDDDNNALDFDALGAMRDCMLSHDDTAACHALHYVYQLGMLATYLSTV
jgi:hypothetical protein